MQSKPWIFAAAVAAFGACIAAGASPTSGQAEGIWKAVVPPKAMQGEFDNLDPLGVAAGVRIPADCSLNWVDPDDAKLYCFVSGTSLEYFLDAPQTHLRQARAAWRKLMAPST